jgi:hypothetical protein
MKIKSLLFRFINLLLGRLNLSLVKKKSLLDFYLYNYSSYEEYKNTQIFHNKRKINAVWADEKTLSIIANILHEKFSENKKIIGICHGSRNGFEQNYLMKISNKIDAFGTDISPTANDYKNSIQWDFHNINEKWINSKDFVYTNSLDQSWQPKVAIQTWLSQLKKDGILIIEHTDAHGSDGTSKMDPFGARPTSLPYVFTMWFGTQISIEHKSDYKSNNNRKVWLFILKKNQENVKILSN